VKARIIYCIGDLLILEANSFKYLGIIIHIDLNWADHVNYTLQKSWKALHLGPVQRKSGKGFKSRAK
jgi:hypothetical protein